ncbi:hypothetical protein CC78DRAFT_547361 [Lojkania enalia]|uniref:Uncharacterized protein n=1 Tax=Lojkania enalia TaxID=147567 RepID=A0A9P4K4C5_9PLEO|nr:hypothetical protein CC78DRAFT_547361 [Didymosphaeria enalia]
MANEEITTYRLGNEGVELVLFDKVDGLGQVRSSVKYHFGTITEKRYTAEFRRLDEVHGRFNGSSPIVDNASLLVIRIVPKTDSSKRRFKEFTIAFTVQPDNSISSNDDAPWISAYEPAGDAAEYFQEHITTVSKTSSIGASLTGKPPVGVEPSVTSSVSTQRQFEQRRLLKLTARSFGEQRGRDTTVFYRLEPAFEPDGIGDSLAAALIIRRAPGASFYLKAVTTAKVSYRLGDAPTWHLGKSQENSLRLGPFTPKASEQTRPPGVDQSNLEAASYQILKDLAYVHMPEKGTEKLFLKYRANNELDPATSNERQGSSGLTEAESVLKTLSNAHNLSGVTIAKARGLGSHAMTGKSHLQFQPEPLEDTRRWRNIINS